VGLELHTTSKAFNMTGWRCGFVAGNPLLVKAYAEPDELNLAADPVVQYMNPDELKKQISKLKAAMVKSSKSMDFMEAARLRDEMYALEKLLESKNN
jgi:excinuclease ABC subunit B